MCAIPYRHHVLEVGILLGFLWHHRLAVEIAYNQDQAPSWIVEVCNTAAMTHITRCILEGQLMLKASRSQILAVGIKWDGSGGMFRLGKRPPSCALRFVLDREQQIYSFSVDDSGRHLTSTKPTPPTSLSLPVYPVLSEIFSEVVNHQEETCIDLDNSNRLPLTFAHANRRLYATYRECLLRAGSYALHLHSQKKRSTFSNFSKLSHILRHKFTLPKNILYQHQTDDRPLRWSTNS